MSSSVSTRAASSRSLFPMPDEPAELTPEERATYEWQMWLPGFGEEGQRKLKAVPQRKPLVECAMYAMEARLTVFRPGETGCLECLHPEAPPEWQRQFPVLGAVSGAVACLGAVEVVKLLTGLGTPLLGTLLTMD